MTDEDWRGHVPRGGWRLLHELIKEPREIDPDSMIEPTKEKFGELRP
jgi:hypothetical protein